MNTKAGRGNLRSDPLAGSVSTLTAIFVLAFGSLAHSATNTVASVADTGAGSLRQLMADSGAGDTIVFGVTGTITLASGELVVDKDLSIVGPGTSVLAINGGQASRIFNIRSNVTALIAGLTITGGRTPYVTGSGNSEPGGGIYNGGSLWLSNCVVAGNRTGATGTNAAAGGCGGGVYNISTLRLEDSSVDGNETGGGTANGSGGDGGGVWNGGTCFANRCSFGGNGTADGSDPSYNDYDPPPGGSGGRGGGIFNSSAMALANCTIGNNHTGRGGNGNYGILHGGPGGAGGSGGGIYSQGALSLVGCTIAGNRTGCGGNGGYSYFGPAAGGNGGSGGGVFGSGRIVLTNCTLAVNSCGIGGVPGPWNGGCGGGICGGATVVSCTIVSNTAYGGSGGGVYESGAFLNSIVALNSVLADGQGLDVYGTFNSLGHNLIGATNNSSGFTAPGDLVGSKASPLDPRVAPLANNGGTTLTMALMPGSPANDAGDTLLAPTTDQRGFPRPAGLAADIGAFEYDSVIPTLAVSLSGTNGLNLLGSGNAGQFCRLLWSPDLTSWVPLATNQIGSDGTVLFYDTCAAGSASRFYRLVMP